jgi:hypothetical protein
MPEYRIYTLDYNGHRVDAKNIQCVDDQEAVALLPRYEKAPPESINHRSRRTGGHSH